ncbi:MAG: hypothetical protein HKN79_09785 [Flavobacteriales bacterium]|nr:hypothetical protein [Flavobacteriales bacterium]
MKGFLCIAIIFFTIPVLGQRDTLGRYSPGFKFKDGLYTAFQEFKDNCPAYPIDQLRDEMGNTLDRIDAEQPWFIASQDSLLAVSKDSIWGFSSSGKVYLKNQDFFDRMVVIGTLCHVIHREEIMDYNNTLYNGFTYAPVRREVQVEFFVDMRTGEKYEFNEKNLSEQISDDPILRSSYSQLTRKKRKENMFRFLHTYNQNHPIYFPISRCR